MEGWKIRGRKGLQGRDNMGKTFRGRLAGWSCQMALRGLTLGVGFLAAGSVGLLAGETPAQVIDKVYGPQMAKAKASPDTKDDLELAKNMLNDAKGMAKEPAMQEALLRRALAYSVEDQEGEQLAIDIVSALMRLNAIKEEDAWRELVKKGQDALRKRNLGQADQMLDGYFNWQLQMVRAEMEAYNGPAAEKQLTSLATESQTLKLKYQADQARQLIARIRFEAPFQTAAAAARAKAAGDDLQLKASEDPKSNLAAGETILSQTGNWADAAPFLVRSKDARWNLILNLRLLRKAPNGSPANEFLPCPPRSPLTAYTEQILEIPALGDQDKVPVSMAGSKPPAPVALPAQPAAPAPAALGEAQHNRLPWIPRNMTEAQIDAMSPQEFDSLKRAIERSFVEMQERENTKPPEPAAVPAPPASVKTADLLAAVDYLNSMAGAAKRPSPVGKVALLREAAGLMAQALLADNATLTVAQKLDLPNRQRTAKEAADKAVADLMVAFDRTAQLPWVNLSTGNMKADWASSVMYAHWKSLEGGVLETSNGTWDSMLRSTNVRMADFIVECECYTETTDSHVTLYLREHFGAPYYQVGVTSFGTYLMFRKDLFNFSTDLASSRTGISPKTWTPLRVVFEGDHYMVWLNGKQQIDAKAEGNTGAGPICLVGLDGVIKYRNIRIRELK